MRDETLVGLAVDGGGRGGGDGTLVRWVVGEGVGGGVGDEDEVTAFGEVSSDGARSCLDGESGSLRLSSVRDIGSSVGVECEAGGVL